MYFLTVDSRCPSDPSILPRVKNYQYAPKARRRCWPRSLAILVLPRHDRRLCVECQSQATPTPVRKVTNGILPSRAKAQASSDKVKRS